MRIPDSSDGSRVETVLRSAERRRMLVLAAEQAGGGIALALSGLILLLVLGTQILHWYWPAMLAFAGTALMVARRRQRPLERYRLAQIIDRRLGLSDSLSTAWFLLHAGVDSPMVRLQIERAEAAAQSVRVARAIPFTRGRPWMVSGALAAVALGLFTTRYLMTSSLGLEGALIPMHGRAVLQAEEEPRAREDHGSMTPFAPDATAGVGQAARAQGNDGKPDHSASEMSDSGKHAAMAVEPATASHSAQLGASESGQSSGEARSPGSSQAQANNGDRAARSTGDANNQRGAAQPNSSNLLDNMKDALSSLLAKMRPDSSPQSAAGARQSSEQRTSTQSALGRERQAGQTGAQKDGSSEESKAGAAEAAEKAHASPARASGESPARNGSDSRSGVGRQDGNKDLKEAEQLETMGKLAEIIGKRSADLTGEMTVETPSGKQQLKTEYSQRMGHHADLGGEIEHNEIPPMYRQYVRDYMEAVRKQAPPP